MTAQNSSVRSFSGIEWPPPRSFWQHEFEELTQGGVAPFLFQGLLPASLRCHDRVDDALREMQQRLKRGEATSARVRVYVDEKRTDDLVGQVLEEDFPSEETLPMFAARATGVERFGLVINNLEVLSKPLAADLGDFIQSMFRVRGVPIGGCEQVAFAGNYEGTPFGVHEGYEHAFLFHLGPNTKDFYCWWQEDYVRLTGGRQPTFGNYEWLLREGQKFVLAPGDVLYLPALVYHVGKLTEYAVSVAVPLYTYPVERYLLRAVLPVLTESLLSQIESGPSRHEPLYFNSNPLPTSLTPLFEATLQKLSAHSEEHLASILADRWFRMISNGGWEVSQAFAEEGRYSPLDVQIGSALALERPYRLCWEADSGGRMRVFLCGGRVTVEDQGELTELFTRLNNGELITIDTDEEVTALRSLSTLGGLILS